MTDEEYSYLQEQINKLTGIDLRNYKTPQMRRRLDGFLARFPGSGVAPYCQMLAKDPEALQRLKDFLTINVSEFFRDTPQFKILQDQILPELMKKGATVSVWSAGCSMGAEPYSVAMAITEIDPKARYRILATDLDQNVLAKARGGGPYTEADIKNVSKQLRQKYFTQSADGYRVVDSLKPHIQFRQHNLLKDTFSKGFDLVICRNVVIYFSDEAKRTLNKGFYDSLNDNGVFFIGGTESLLDAQQLGFNRINSSFYRKTTPAAKAESSESQATPVRSATTTGRVRVG